MHNNSWRKDYKESQTCSLHEEEEEEEGGEELELKKTLAPIPPPLAWVVAKMGLTTTDH